MAYQISVSPSHMRLVYGLFMQVFIFLISRTFYVLVACLVAWPLLIGLTLAIDAGLLHPATFVIVGTIFFWPLSMTYGETLMSGVSLSLTEADILGLATLWLVYLAIAEWVLRKLGVIKDRVKLRYYTLALTVYFALTAAVTLVYGTNSDNDVSVASIMFFVSWLVTIVCVCIISLLNTLKHWLMKRQ